LPRRGRTGTLAAMTTTTDTIADAILAAWNERDAGRRAELVAAVWTEDGHLADPPLEGRGHEAIAGMAAALQQQFDGHRFRRASAVDQHHGFFRYAWELVGPDGTVALTGLDVGELAEDGRVRRISGFFGELEPAR
jgi:hypothetical protein